MSDIKDKFKIDDPTILTYVEHKLIGSSVERDDATLNPFKPLAVLDGRRPIDVAAQRVTKREIKGMDGKAFDLPENKLPIVALNVISNKNGEVIDKNLRLTGIFDFVTEEEERDPEVLKQYSLTEEGKRKYGIDAEVGRREKVG